MINWCSVIFLLLPLCFYFSCLLEGEWHVIGSAARLLIQSTVKLSSIPSSAESSTEPRRTCRMSVSPSLPAKKIKTESVSQEISQWTQRYFNPQRRPTRLYSQTSITFGKCDFLTDTDQLLSVTHLRVSHKALPLDQFNCCFTFSFV